MSPYLGKFIARQRANIGKRALITLDICPRRRKVASIVCKFTGLRLFLHSPKACVVLRSGLIFRPYLPAVSIVFSMRLPTSTPGWS